MQITEFQTRRTQKLISIGENEFLCIFKKASYLNIINSNFGKYSTTLFAIEISGNFLFVLFKIFVFQFGFNDVEQMTYSPVFWQHSLLCKLFSKTHDGRGIRFCVIMSENVECLI